MGGLGVRRVSSLALPAFLASAAGTLELQSSILGDGFDVADNRYLTDLEEWRSRTGIREDSAVPRSQASWDKPLILREVAEMEEGLVEPVDKARLRAVSAPHAGDWLYALPIASCGIRLSDDAVRIAVGLRLGAAICEPHVCGCGSLVSARGTHCLSCSLGFGRIARHAALNDAICRGLTRAGFPSVKEPPGLVRSDGKRPDGLTLIPWRGGKSLVWDATVIDSLAASYVSATAVKAGAAAEIAALRKTTKYTELSDDYIFAPLAFETLGPMNDTGLSLISDIGRHLTLSTGDLRETSYLFQRLSFIIQRFNAVAICGTLINLVPEPEE